ncbi:14503_t:CDS:2, partial [Cetraspora pellucida]
MFAIIEDLLKFIGFGAQKKKEEETLSVPRATPGTRISDIFLDLDDGKPIGKYCEQSDQNDPEFC